MAVEVRIVVYLYQEEAGNKKSICKLYCIIEGDEWYGKEQQEEDWLCTGLLVATGRSRVRR